MAAHAHLKNEFTGDEKYYNLMGWLKYPLRMNPITLSWLFYPAKVDKNIFHLRNRSALAVNCWEINHGLDVSCKVDYILSAKRECYIHLKPSDKS